MNQELLRLVDRVHRDKNIDKEIVFQGIEQALASAARKAYTTEDVIVEIDRETGDISASENGRDISPRELGRIAAQTAKQVMIQKIREAERDVIFNEYTERVGVIVNGTVQRFEGSTLVVNLGKTEGIVPRSEQIPGEAYQPGERIRVLVYEVRKVGPRVKIILSRTHPEFVRKLFELEVPEVADRIIEIKGIAREAGQRSKVAVRSIDSKVDCVGACVGVRGSRIKSIVDEVNGEKIDIVRWNDSPEVLIVNCLKPAEITAIELNDRMRRARVIVAEDQLSLAIGKKGQNVRLAGKLCGWELDVVSPTEAAQLAAEDAARAEEEGEYEEARGVPIEEVEAAAEPGLVEADEGQGEVEETPLEAGEPEEVVAPGGEVEEVEADDFSEIPGVGGVVAEHLYNAGFMTLEDLYEAGEEGLKAVEGVGAATAKKIAEYLDTFEVEEVEE